MDFKTNQQENFNQPMADETGCQCAAAENILERGAEVFDKAKHAVINAYGKTSRGVCKTCEQARGYCSENPGKTVLIALGAGVGLGIILGSRSHRSRTSRIAQPMVNALSDMALAIFR